MDHGASFWKMTEEQEQQHRKDSEEPGIPEAERAEQSKHEYLTKIKQRMHKTANPYNKWIVLTITILLGLIGTLITALRGTQ